MEKIKKSSQIAVNLTKTFRNLSIAWIIIAIIGAIISIAMNGYIAQYYSDPSNLAAASASLNADMGVFSILPLASLKEAGNYGAYFAVQLLCTAVTGFVYTFLFIILKKTMENIRDTGKAFAAPDAAKTKTFFIIVTVLLFVFSGLFEAVIAGILLCALYNVTVAEQE